MSTSYSKVGKSYVMVTAFISTGIIFLIVAVLLMNSWSAITQVGWQLLTLKWNPAAGEYGILSMLYGSFTVTFCALVIALPLGLLSAIFVSEVLPGRYRFYVKSLLELLAGIPSIIYGLLGVAFLSVWIGHLFDLQSGRTILSAGILLAVMIMPTIITLSDDALQNVPNKYREAANGLGLTKYEVLKSAVLPIAKADIIGACLLALGRALGKTMAVMLVIGGIDRIPSPFFNVLNPGQTITSKLGREISETAFGSVHFSAMILMGMILLVVVLILTVVAQHCFNPEHRLYE